MHVGMGNHVTLQTVQAVAKGRRGDRIRVLFDLASHKPFVTSRTVDSLGLNPLRSEWLAVNSFSRKANKTQLRYLVEVEMTTVGGWGGSYTDGSVCCARNIAHSERAHRNS